MKNCIAYLLFCTMAAASASEGVAPEIRGLDFQPKSMLVVGNSYMYYNCGINGYLSGLIREKVNPKIKTRIAAIGRSNMSQQPIEELLDNSKLSSHSPQNGSLDKELLSKEIKKRESYELVLLQGSNRGPEDQALDRFYIKIHADAIRQNGGTPALIMTWVQKKKDAPAQQIVADKVTEIGNENKMLVIPVGLAFENVEKKYPDLKLIMPDNTHPTALGSYLMAATIYAAVYKRNPLEAVNFSGGCEKPLDRKQREEICQTAWDTVKSWYRWQ